MSRLPGIDLPGVAQYLVQRRRRPCGVDDGDRLRYLHDLRRIARREFCAVHAYVLMAGHVRLLVTPMAPGQVRRMMQALGHQRDDTCGDRYRACPVFEDAGILRCQRYIELGPVRAGLVAHPGRYRWSSHAGNASPVPDPLLQPHRAWLALGADAASRRQAWQAFVMGAHGVGEAGATGPRRCPPPLPGQVAAR